MLAASVTAGAVTLLVAAGDLFFRVEKKEDEDEEGVAAEVEVEVAPPNWGMAFMSKKGLFELCFKYSGTSAHSSRALAASRSLALSPIRVRSFPDALVGSALRST